MSKINWCTDYRKSNVCKPTECAECPYLEDKEESENGFDYGSDEWEQA